MFCSKGEYMKKSELNLTELGEQIYDKMFSRLPYQYKKNHIHIPVYIDGDNYRLEIGYFGNKRRFEVRIHFPTTYIFSVEASGKIKTLQNPTSTTIKKSIPYFEEYLKEFDKLLSSIITINHYMETLKYGEYGSYTYNRKINIGSFALSTTSDGYKVMLNDYTLFEFGGSGLSEKCYFISSEAWESPIDRIINIKIVVDLLRDAEFELDCLLNEKQDHQELYSLLSESKVTSELYKLLEIDGKVILILSEYYLGYYQHSERVEFVKIKDHYRAVIFKGKLKSDGIEGSPRELIEKIEEVITLSEQKEQAEKRLRSILNKNSEIGILL